MKIVDKNGNVSYPLKIRGITLNHEVSQVINYESFKKLVLEPDNNPLIADYNSIRGSKYGDLFTQKTSKIYRPVIQKGIRDNFIIKPFGF